MTVNYRTQDVAAALKAEFPQGFDLIYEGVGGEMGKVVKGLLKEGPSPGTLVNIGSVSTDYSKDPASQPKRPRLSQTAPKTDAKEETDKPRITGFFMPNGPAYGEEWEKLVQRSIDAIIGGQVKLVIDDECSELQGYAPARSKYSLAYFN